MYLGEASSKRRKQIIGGITAALILSFLIAFWPEIVDFFGIVKNFIQIVLGTKSLVEWATAAQVNSLLILTYTCGVGFLGVFMVWLILLAFQAILPVEGFTEAYRTAWHLLLYLLGRHGQAVLIRDGEIKKRLKMFAKVPA